MLEPVESHPGLWRELLPVLSRAGLPAHAVGRSGGPRRWWGGPLDVEGVALGSVEAVAVALRAFAARESIPLSAGYASEGVAASFASWTHLRVGGEPIVGFAPLSGFHRSVDGWVRVHANYPHHASALLSALDVASPDRVGAALRQRSSADIEDAVTSGGGVAVRVRTPGEWAASPSALAFREEPWIRFDVRETSGHSRGMRSSPAGKADASLPLAGFRILDFSRVVAGPAATRLLGALGADVVRVDPPHMPELLDMHLDSGFDKRIAFADLTRGAELNTVRELVGTADAVLLGYRGSALSRFGLDAASLGELHPDLPVVTLDAWGDGGPWACRRGFDSIVQAATGISVLYGSGTGEDWTPGALPVQALDHTAGMGAAAAVIALLASRRNGVVGSAHLSLAGTAQQLLASPNTQSIRSSREAKHTLEAPLRGVASHYGDIVFVPPPLLIGGRQLEYRHPPRKYGSSSLEWFPR